MIEGQSTWMFRLVTDRKNVLGDSTGLRARWQRLAREDPKVPWPVSSVNIWNVLEGSGILSAHHLFGGLLFVADNAAPFLLFPVINPLWPSSIYKDAIYTSLSSIRHPTSKSRRQPCSTPPRKSFPASLIILIAPTSRSFLVAPALQARRPPPVLTRTVHSFPKHPHPANATALNSMSLVHPLHASRELHPPAKPTVHASRRRTVFAKNAPFVLSKKATTTPHRLHLAMAREATLLRPL